MEQLDNRLSICWINKVLITSEIQFLKFFKILEIIDLQNNIVIASKTRLLF